MHVHNSCSLLGQLYIFTCLHTKRDEQQWVTRGIHKLFKTLRVVFSFIKQVEIRQILISVIRHNRILSVAFILTSYLLTKYVFAASYLFYLELIGV